MEKGVICFMKENIGSKSECVSPFLDRGGGDFLRLFKKGDNPFENEELKPYEGKCVEIMGEKDRNGTFIVEQIKEI